jgi:hypothetical protein
MSLNSLTERHLDATGPQAQPIGVAVVDVEPVELRVEVAARAEVSREELSTDAELLLGRRRDVHPDLGELEAATQRTRQIVVVRRLDETLAGEAVHLDRLGVSGRRLGLFGHDLARRGRRFARLRYVCRCQKDNRHEEAHAHAVTFRLMED